MKIRDLLIDESRWCIGMDAVTDGGLSCIANNPRAVQWCLVGAIKKCYPDATDLIRERVADRIGESITDWNDSKNRTFAEVRALIEELDI